MNSPKPTTWFTFGITQKIVTVWNKLQNNYRAILSNLEEGSDQKSQESPQSLAICRTLWRSWLLFRHTAIFCVRPRRRGLFGRVRIVVLVSLLGGFYSLEQMYSEGLAKCQDFGANEAEKYSPCPLNSGEGWDFHIPVSGCEHIQ